MPGPAPLGKAGRPFSRVDRGTKPAPRFVEAGNCWRDLQETCIRPLGAGGAAKVGRHVGGFQMPRPRAGFAAGQLFGALARLSVSPEWNWMRQLKGKLPSFIQYGWGALPNKG
jgi:hypothetical protein